MSSGSRAERELLEHGAQQPGTYSEQSLSSTSRSGRTPRPATMGPRLGTHGRLTAVTCQLLDGPPAHLPAAPIRAAAPTRLHGLRLARRHWQRSGRIVLGSKNNWEISRHVISRSASAGDGRVRATDEAARQQSWCRARRLESRMSALPAGVSNDGSAVRCLQTRHRR